MTGRFRAVVLVALGAVAAVACGASASGGPSGRGDAGQEARGGAAGVDGAPDAQAGAPQAGPDAGPDAPIDAPADAPADSVADGPPDAGGQVCSAGASWGVAHRSCDGLDPSLCGQVLVKGGTWQMGRAGAYDGNTKMTPADVHSVTTTDFYLEANHVSVARFQKYFNAGMPPPPDGYPLAPGICWKSAWNVYLLEPDVERQSYDTGCTPGTCDPTVYDGTFCTWSWAKGERDPNVGFADMANKPINCMTWPLAAAFCAWDGMRLPSEAEWEYAARNRGQAVSYPWGNTQPTCSQADTGLCPTAAYPDDIATHLSGDTTDPAGLHDMIGGVRDWTVDLFQKYSRPAGCWQPGNYGVDPVCPADPTYPAGPQHTSRGVSWQNAPTPAEDRMPRWLDSDWRYVGFRCARDP